MSDWRIPLSDLDFGPEELSAVQRVITSKWLSMGPEVLAFEKEFADMQQARHAITVANATAGLHLAFLALGLRPGDEVIQPALNFVASANMTAATGATPVFADITSLEEPTLDPTHVAQLITPRTKAVVAMHYGGNQCRMAELLQLCCEHNLPLVEDACHAVGAEARDTPGKKAGSLGDIGAFSFFANKNLATGEGGMVVTDRDDLANRVRQLRSHGMTTLTWDRHKGHASTYDVTANGYNYRLDELHAALGRAQLAKLPGNNASRRRLLTRYHENLQDLKSWIMPFADRIAESSGHLMPLLAPTPEARSTAAQALRHAGIQTSLHYPCIPDFTAFVSGQAADVPLSREFSRRVLTLPLFPTLAEAAVDEVCSVIRASAPASG